MTQPHTQPKLKRVTVVLEGKEELFGIDGHLQEIYSLSHKYHTKVISVRRDSLVAQAPAAPATDSANLIRMADTEWHNREERRGIHERVPWTAGWMSGYLTPNKPRSEAQVHTLKTMDLHNKRIQKTERDHWKNRLNGILKTAKFYDQVDEMLQEVVKEMEEESA